MPQCARARSGSEFAGLEQGEHLGCPLGRVDDGSNHGARTAEVVRRAGEQDLALVEHHERVHESVQLQQQMAREHDLRPLVLEQLGGAFPKAAELLEAAERAMEIIRGLTREPQIGEEFEGTVRRIEPYGAFVEILPEPVVGGGGGAVLDLRREADALLELLSRVEADRAWFLEANVMEASQSTAVRGLVNRLCREVREYADFLVDGFGIPDAVLAAPAGLKDVP